MDNLTHSLSGALAAKLLPPVSDEPAHRRTLFWVFVLSANLPDIDWVLRFVDYFYYLVNHRGITHSLLFAPVLALLPAWLFFRFSRVKNFAALWTAAVAGILVHICFDLVTSFGTMLFAPFSSQRYALDWMFIVDPVFTAGLLLVMILGRTWKSRSTWVARAGGFFVFLYLLAEFVSHEIAINKVHQYIRREGITATHQSALPQPLSIFRWNGLVQTQGAVHQAFFSVFDDSIAFTELRDSLDAYVAKVTELDEFKQYRVFARHPWIQSFREGEKHIVELRDLQFSVPPEILQRFGAENRQQPFLMQYEFAADGTLEKIIFDNVVMID